MGGLHYWYAKPVLQPQACLAYYTVSWVSLLLAHFATRDRTFIFGAIKLLWIWLFGWFSYCYNPYSHLYWSMYVLITFLIAALGFNQAGLWGHPTLKTFLLKAIVAVLALRIVTAPYIQGEGQDDYSFLLLGPVYLFYLVKTILQQFRQKISKKGSWAQRNILLFLVILASAYFVSMWIFVQLKCRYKSIINETKDFQNYQHENTINETPGHSKCGYMFYSVLYTFPLMLIGAGALFCEEMEASYRCMSTRRAKIAIILEKKEALAQQTAKKQALRQSLQKGEEELQQISQQIQHLQALLKPHSKPGEETHREKDMTEVLRLDYE